MKTIISPPTKISDRMTVAPPQKIWGSSKKTVFYFSPHLRDKVKLSFDFCSKTGGIEGEKKNLVLEGFGWVRKKQTING